MDLVEPGVEIFRMKHPVPVVLNGILVENSYQKIPADSIPPILSDWIIVHVIQTAYAQLGGDESEDACEEKVQGDEGPVVRGEGRSRRGRLLQLSMVQGREQEGVEDVADGDDEEGLERVHGDHRERMSCRGLGLPS